MPAFIHDGFTLSAFIAADEPAHESVTFEYRPATRSEVSAWRTHRDVVSGEEVGKRDAAFISKHLVSWDIRYPSGKSSGELVPITPDNCGKLSTAVAARFIEIIALADAGDSKPGQPEPQQPDLESAEKN